MHRASNVVPSKGIPPSNRTSLWAFPSRYKRASTDRHHCHHASRSKDSRTSLHPIKSDQHRHIAPSHTERQRRRHDLFATYSLRLPQIHDPPFISHTSLVRLVTDHIQILRPSSRRFLDLPLATPRFISLRARRIIKISGISGLPTSTHQNTPHNISVAFRTYLHTHLQTDLPSVDRTPLDCTPASHT